MVDNRNSLFIGNEYEVKIYVAAIENLLLMGIRFNRYEDSESSILGKNISHHLNRLGFFLWFFEKICLSNETLHNRYEKCDFHVAFNKFEVLTVVELVTGGIVLLVYKP